MHTHFNLAELDGIIWGIQPQIDFGHRHTARYSARLVMQIETCFWIWSLFAFYRLHPQEMDESSLSTTYQKAEKEAEAFVEGCCEAYQEQQRRGISVGASKPNVHQTIVFDFTLNWGRVGLDCGQPKFTQQGMESS